MFHRLCVESLFSPSNSKQVLVSWSLSQSFKAPGPFTYTLEQAGSPSADNWSRISQAVDQTWLYDNFPKKRAHDFSRYYRVVLEDADGVQHTSQAVSFYSMWDHYNWRLMRQYVRQQVVGLKKRGGAPGWLLKRRTSGEACEVCKNPNTGQVTDSKCGTCYGTGFVGGYYAAIPYPTFRSPTQRSKKSGGAGIESSATMTLIGLAQVGPDSSDIWVNAATHECYTILEQLQAAAEHQGVPVTLTIPVELLPATDSAYDFPVPRYADAL